MSRADQPTAAQLNNAALAVLPQLLGQWLPCGEMRGQKYVALNPRRQDRHLGSFQIDLRSGRWHDHAVGLGGRNILSLLAYLRCGGDIMLAIKLLADEPMVRAALATGLCATIPAKLAKVANEAPSPDRLHRVFDTALHLAGTPGEAYLLGRHLRKINAWSVLRIARLRHPSGGRYWSLLAPFTDLEGTLVGLLRTYLQTNGRKLAVDPVRMTLGSVQGAAIRLGEPDDTLILCEGLEDGLTLAQELDDHVVWVAGGAGRMATIAIPASVRRLIIAADNDQAGRIAAQQAAERHNLGGREVRIMRPDERFKDFNDELRGIAHGA